jgi:hypothetical protein
MAEDKKAINLKRLKSLNPNKLRSLNTRFGESFDQSVKVPSDWKNDEHFYRRLMRDRKTGPIGDRLLRMLALQSSPGSGFGTREGRKMINKILYGNNTMDSQKPLNLKKLGSMNTQTMKKGGKVKAKKPRDGRIKKAKGRDGIAQRGKTRGRMR